METMKAYNHKKYQPFAFAVDLADRQWPNKRITKAPDWASVDLRDGNQALIDPMNIEQKLRLWDTLVKCGFKEIEIGFPSASQTEFDFTRRLIDEHLIPDDVTVQVLVQAREHLIRRTFESLEGVKRAIIHVYNSTSKVQREKAFAKSKDEIKEIAVNGATLVRDLAKQYAGSEWVFQYSPESFSQTEADYSIEVCDAVCAVWQPEKGQQVILNLPATVESSTPNIFADQVEYFCRHLKQRQHVRVSVHTHNDRGCGVAAAELAVLAGADRVEGTLFGNGERTGNMDIVTMAMNLYSQGIDPKLNFANMAEIAQCATECTNLPIHPRHPYAGELVFTAFSGSHQDAIKKCLERPFDGTWDVAYLPIDPKDIGRSYQDVVRINSQSGKGGVAYILKQNYGLELPRWLQIDFSQVVQRRSEQTEKELSGEDIWQLFQGAYMNTDAPYQLQRFNIDRRDKDDSLTAVINTPKGEERIEGKGAGTITAFVLALKKYTGKNMRVIHYHQHALSVGTRAEAAAYVQLDVEGELFGGVASSHDTVTGMLRATVAAVNAGAIDFNVNNSPKLAARKAVSKAANKAASS